MPIVDLAPIPPGLPLDTPKGMAVTPGAPGEIEQSPQWTAAGLVGASFQQENSIVSYLAGERRHQIENDGVDPWAEIKGTPYEARWESFADVTNRTDLDAVKRQIDRETENRRIIDAAPAWASLPMGMVAGVLDWPSALPGGAFIRGAKGGVSVARSALSVGTAAGAGVTAQELALQDTQELRTAGESAVNISAGVLIGGLLGAAGARLLSGAEWSEAARRVDDELLSSTAAVPHPAEASPVSLGAAALGGKSLDELSISGAASKVAKATAWTNPGQRLMQSPNELSRDTALNLFDMTQYLRGNRDGMATPQAVETLRKEWNSGLMQAETATDAAYKAYRQRAGKDALSRSAFEEEAGRAAYRGDTHEIPEIAQAAQAWRKNVFDPLKDEAVKLKLLPEDVPVETAASYFSRVPNRIRMQADEHGFKAAVAEWVHRSAPRWRAEFEAEAAKRLDEARAKAAGAGEGKKAEAQRALRDIETEIRTDREARFGDPDATWQRARDVADEVFDKYTGRAVTEPGQRPERITVGARGPLRGRTFNMPDELLDPWMEHNIRSIGERYHRIMATDVELTRKFGDPLLTEPLQKIKDRYRELRAAETAENRLLALDKAERADLRDIEGIRDLLRQNYPQSQAAQDYGHVLRIARAFNYLRLMGQVMLSSLPEAARTPMVHGLGTFMGDSFSALRNLDMAKLNVNEAKLAGNVSDRVLAHRLATVADITDTYTSKGPVEKFMDNMTNVASNWNGIRLWTDFARSIGTIVSQNRILRTAEKWDTARPKDRELLNFLGIDEAMARRIAKQFEEHGETAERVRVAGTERWTDEGARRAYRAALNKDLDSLVVTRSVADIPLMANTELGRTIAQFNTFNLASHQRVLLRGLQEGPARFTGGLIALTSMGMLGTWLAAAAGNRTDKLPAFAENPGWWIGEGLDRSGVLMLPFMLANASEKLTGMNPIRGPMKAFDAGRQGSERVRARNLSSLFGPSAGLVEDVFSIPGTVGAATRGEVTQSQRNAMERLVPFQSYAGMRQMLRYVINPPNE